MQLSPLNLNLLPNANEADSNTVETPIKKSRGGFHSHLKTAESPNMQMSASKHTIAEIDAEELFDNFSRIVTISESNQKFEAEQLYRKIQYEQENSKLDFEQSTNSMKKKRRGSRLLPGQEGECIKVKPFLLNQNCTQSENSNKKQQAQNMQEEDMSPQLKRRNTKNAMMSTPAKKTTRTADDLEKAAKKECPFRDLQSRRNLFG